MTVEATITGALFARLSALTLSPVHPVSWPYPATVFVPPASHKFLRVSHFPTVEQQRAIADDGTIEFRGFLQVDVFAPLNAGLTGPIETAGLVAQHFRSQRRLFASGVRIEITGALVQGAVNSDPRLMIPVTVNYRAFGKN